jgi:dipeptidyl-peptidase-4
MKAGKRFEFVIMPGQRHGFGDFTEYAFLKLADHFNKYLIGDFLTIMNLIWWKWIAILN